MARGRDEDRYKLWLKNHRGIILKVARAFAASAEDQDDLVQEILLRVWSAMPSFREEAQPSTWIYRVALNRALTWQRDEKRRRGRQSRLVDVADHRGDADSQHAHLLDQLYRELRKLNEIDRSLILMTLDGCNYKDMADVMGMTVNHVGVRLSRAKKKLSEAMTRGGC